MAYSVLTNEINTGVLYYVAGTKSVVYNTVTYNTGQYFRGVAGNKIFTYSGSGTQEVNEVFELFGGAVEYVLTLEDSRSFPDITLLTGMAIEMEMNTNEQIVNEITKLNGFAIELIDYPFFVFQITKRIN